MDAQTIYSLGIVLIFAGIFIILLAFLLLFYTSAKKTEKIKGGGALIIGPFPIIFGTDKESLRTVLILSIILTVLLIAALIIFYLLPR
ncbi:MAG: TIGR00304 family membrane protein [Candidatus Bathycorpusculaceae bacterium]